MQFVEIELDLNEACSMMYLESCIGTEPGFRTLPGGGPVLQSNKKTRSLPLKTPSKSFTMQL